MSNTNHLTNFGFGTRLEVDPIFTAQYTGLTKKEGKMNALHDVHRILGIMAPTDKKQKIIPDRKGSHYSESITIPPIQKPVIECCEDWHEALALAMKNGQIT
jgi:hypothetical protein